MNSLLLIGNIHITSEAPTQSLIEIQKNMAAIKEEQRKKEDQKIRRTQEEAKRRSREKRLAQEPRTSAGSSERKSASSQSHSTPITVKVVAQPLSTPARSVQHSGLISMKVMTCSKLHWSNDSDTKNSATPTERRKVYF